MRGVRRGSSRQGMRLFHVLFHGGVKPGVGPLVTVVLAVLAALGSACPARAALPFASRQDGPRGVVTAYGMDLFILPGGAGGYSALERAQVVALRVDERLREPGFVPTRFRLALRNREVVLECVMPQGPPQVIVTVDRRLSKSMPGAAGSRVRVAQWWLALLRDMALLTRGDKPAYTLGVGKYPVLGLVYDDLVSHGLQPGRRMEPAWIPESVARLSRKYEDFGKVYKALGASVPYGFEEPLEEPESVVTLAPAPVAPPSPGTVAEPPDAEPGEEGQPRVLSSPDAAAQPDDGAPDGPGEEAAPAREAGPYVLEVPVSSSKRIRIGLAPGEEAQVDWAGGEKGIRRVEFATLNAEGKALEQASRESAPFGVKLRLTPEVSFFYIVTHYTSGVVSTWTVPYLEPPG